MTNVITSCLLAKSIPSMFKTPQLTSFWLNSNLKKFLHSSTPVNYEWDPNRGPRKFKQYNEIMFPPQAPDEKPRPAYVCHHVENVKYSDLKLWYVACLVRGMAIDEALRQLDYVRRKGGAIVKTALLEAQELAVKEHNVEFRSNLWVAESFATKGIVVKGLRRHAKRRFGLIRYKHSHYFVRLEEGPPPEHYYPPEQDGPTLLQKWIEERRKMQIFRTL